MSNRLLAHTRRNVIAYAALFVALGGVSYAVQTAPKNSVVSRSIKNGQVKRPDLATNAVDSNRIADAQVTSPDLAAGAVDEAKIAPKAVGTSQLSDGAVSAAKLAPGAAGGVVARAVSTTPTASSGGTVPFDGNSQDWTQAADENDLIMGVVNVTPPATCSGGSPFLVLDADVSGTYAGGNQLYPFGSFIQGQSNPTPVFLDHNFLVEPGSPTPRVIQLFASDNCGGANEHFTINSAKIVVIGEH